MLALALARVQARRALAGCSSLSRGLATAAADAPNAAAAAKDAFFARAVKSVRSGKGGKELQEAADKFETLSDALNTKSLALKKQGLSTKQARSRRRLTCRAVASQLTFCLCHPNALPPLPAAAQAAAALRGAVQARPFVRCGRSTKAGGAGQLSRHPLCSTELALPFALCTPCCCGGSVTHVGHC